MKNIRLVSIALLLAGVLTFASCETQTPADTSASSDTPKVTDTSAPDSDSGTSEAATEAATEETDSKDSDTEKESEKETESGEKDTDKAEKDTDKEDEKESDGKDTVKKEYGLYNFLTGSTDITKEQQKKRPVAIMVNNIRESLPQIGIGDGDLYYEISAEGGVTRIMMLTSDYTKLGTVGSIRSSRDYFVDMLYNHDALYVHAGGSELAYDKMMAEGINNIDGVTMYLPTTFWRDPERLKTMSIEHTLMTSGEGIGDAVKSQKYRTEIEDDYYPMFKFYDEKTDNTPEGSPATHVHMNSTYYQIVDFVYDEKTGEYLRYQYNGMPHVDGANGKQLSFKNVIVLFTDISVIPGDDAGRLAVRTLGEGQGYYMTNGVRKVVNWSREKQEDVMQIEYKNGDELILNCGKTFICIVDTSVTGRIEFEYKW